MAVYPPVHGIATQNSPEHSSVTAITHSLDELSSSLTVPDAFSLAMNCQLLLYMPRLWFSANDSRKTFIINHNESDLYHPVIKPGLLDSQSNVLPVEPNWYMYLIFYFSWYSVKYSNAKTLEWGKNLGCDFATKSCYDWIQTKLSR